MSILTRFLTSGVGSTLEVFLEQVPIGAELYWLTYSFSPPGELLRLLDKRSITTRFVCCHPDNGPIITTQAWARFARAEYAQVRSLRDLPAALDDEDVEPIGLLHAKVIVWHETRRDIYGLATGSFNASDAAWHHNAEVVTFHNRREEAVEAWDYACGIWKRARELEESDIGGPTTRRARREASATIKQWDYTELGRIEGSSHGQRQRARARHRRRPSIQSPEAVAEFAAALDEMLCDYPIETGGRIQWDLYCTLAERSARAEGRRDILYVPVGVGKTFIALRWLCDHLEGKEDGYAAYLVPNRWVQQTVRRHIAYVAERAEVDVDEIERWIRVLRPSEPYALENAAHAVVADECHNWNVSGGQEKSYTDALQECIRGHDHPVLGLSATPCRMENARFNVTNFIETFVERELDEDESEPLLSVADAREHGLICEAKCVPMFENHRETSAAVLDILTRDDGRLVEMGDYSSTTLRNIWETIAEDPEVLVERILTLLHFYDRGRVAVFLPPVGEHTDVFVEVLMERSVGPVFDFRARSVESGMSVFRGFVDADADVEAPPILVTIDRFGEGVSVDDLDALVMLRATLSPRVAMQALGRGLRNAEGKEDCIVLDGVLFQKRVEMFEKGAVTSDSPPLIDGDDDDDDVVVEIDDVDLGNWSFLKGDDDDDDVVVELDDDDELWEALGEPRVLAAMRTELRARGHRRAAVLDRLEEYVDALRIGNEGEFDDFTPAKLAAAVRSERVRLCLTRELDSFGKDVNRRIKVLELPGSRPTRRTASLSRAQLLEQLEAFLAHTLHGLEHRWERNARGQECMVLVGSFQIVRVHRTEGDFLRLVVRGGARDRTCIVESIEDCWGVRYAILQTGRVES